MVEGLDLHSRRRFLTGVAGLGAMTLVDSQAIGASTPAVNRLRRIVSGPVLVHGDDLYEESRRVASHNPTTDKNPAIIVGPTSANDVALAVRFARENGLQLAIQSGGHDVLGESTIDGGILIHMGLMTSVTSDGSRVLVQSGVRAGMLNSELGQYGLAVPLGCHGNVGVTGLTLGGGLGWLLGAYGVTCDHVKAFEIVLADGSVVVANNESHADLFWALRGGGGNYGVVTSISYEAIRINTVNRGFMVFGGDRLGPFMEVWSAFMKTVPRELVVEVVLSRDPEPLVSVTYCHSSPRMRAGLLDPLLEAGKPIATYHDVVPYPQVSNVPQSLLRRFTSSESPTAGDAEAFNYWRGASCGDWNRSAIDALVESFGRAPSGATIGVGHYIHGAALESADKTPVLRSRGTSSYFFNTNWTNNDNSKQQISWVENSIERLRPYAVPAYVNYLSSSEPQAVANAYGKNYRRLSEIKAVYDPSNLFSRNRNVLPAP